MTKNIVALYIDFDAAQSAGRDLVNHGFRSDEISLVAEDPRGEHRARLGIDIKTQADDARVVGGSLGGLAGLLIGVEALVVPGLGPVIAAGPLATGLAGAGVGAVANGLLGALMDTGVPEEEARLFAEGVGRGGTLLTVRLPDDGTEQALDILDRHGAIDVRAREFQGHETPQSDEQTTVPRPAVSPYGGAEYANVKRTGTEYVHEEPLDSGVGSAKGSTEGLVGSPIEPLASPEAGIGFSSGAEQTAAGYQGGPGADRPDSDLAAYEAGFRHHYEIVYAVSSASPGFEHYQPAYMFGHELAADERRSSRKWREIEPEAHQLWDEHHSRANWDDFKAAVRYGWERAAAHWLRQGHGPSEFDQAHRGPQADQLDPPGRQGGPL